MKRIQSLTWTTLYVLAQITWVIYFLSLYTNDENSAVDDLVFSVALGYMSIRLFFSFMPDNIEMLKIAEVNKVNETASF